MLTVCLCLCVHVSDVYDLAGSWSENSTEQVQEQFFFGEQNSTQKKGLGLICRGVHADLDSDCSDCSDGFACWLILEICWNLTVVSSWIWWYIHMYIHIYISLIGGKALGWNKRRNRCLANSNIDHLDPVWTLGFQNLFKLLSKQAGWQLLHHKKQLYLYVYTVYMYVLYYYIVI
jgi:hypothetical protein